MADFCTQCSLYLFGNKAEPEIDIDEIIDSLMPGYYISVGICEGCNLRSISKKDDGTILYGYPDNRDKYIEFFKDLKDFENKIY